MSPEELFRSVTGLPDYPSPFLQGLFVPRRFNGHDRRSNRWVERTLPLQILASTAGAMAVKTASSPQERAGYELFSGKAKCSACHQIWNDAALFTDGEFHDI